MRSEAAVGEADRGERGYVVCLVALFCGGWAVIYADRTVLYPLLSVIAREFRLSGIETGLITGTYFGCYVVAQVTSGLLADRIGFKRILVLSSIVAAVGVLGFGLAAVSYPLLLVVAGLHGAGAGPYYTMAYSLTIHSVPGRLRGLAAGAINGGMSLGLLAGLALAGPVYQATGSWRVPFLILALPTALAVVFYQRTVREVATPARRAVSVAELLADPTLLRMNLAGFCVLYGWWVLLSWGPVFFQTERGVSLTASGLYTLVIAVTAIPAGLGLGRLSDRLGRKRIILSMLPLSALTLFGVPHVFSPAGLLLVLLAYGLVGKLTWDPLAIAWLGDYVSTRRPEAVGSAVGLFSFFSVMSAVVGPPVTGWIKDLTGSLAGGFYLAGGLALAAFFLSAGLADSRGKGTWP